MKKYTINNDTIILTNDGRAWKKVADNEKGILYTECFDEKLAGVLSHFSGFDLDNEKDGVKQYTALITALNARYIVHATVFSSIDQYKYPSPYDDYKYGAPVDEGDATLIVEVTQSKTTEELEEDDDIYQVSWEDGYYWEVMNADLVKERIIEMTCHIYDKYSPFNKLPEAERNAIEDDRRRDVNETFQAI